jgi:hypothetical protein
LFLENKSMDELDTTQGIDGLVRRTAEMVDLTLTTGKSKPFIC